MEDKRKILEDKAPFSWKLTKSGKALIYWNGKMIKTVVGKDFNRLAELIEQSDQLAIQHFLARVTGNFKHGNEK